MPFTVQKLRRLNTFYYRDLYRVMHNFLTHFAKLVYLNGGKDIDSRHAFRNRSTNSPNYIWTRSGRWDSSVAAATSTSTTAEDQALIRWPRRSRDLRPCYFFLWGRSKDSVFPPPLPQDLYEMWRRIIFSVSEINPDVLQRVWAEVDIYLMSMCNEGCTYRAQVWDMEKKKEGSCSFHFQVACYNPIHHSNVQILWKVSGNYE